MTPGIFLALLIAPLIIIAAVTISICRNVSAAADDARAIIHNRAETRRNYARARMEAE